MTIEEKAKAYDEALERAKQKHGKFSEFVTKTIEEIFPQLRESEDERMRKLIIDRVSSATEMTEGLRELLLTYLEKQKEQKPAEWSEEDQDKINTILGVLHLIGNYNFDSWLKSIRPQPKQEWNEYDNEMFHCICAGLCHLRKLYEKNEDAVSDYNAMIEWFRNRFKSFRLQSNPKCDKESLLRDLKWIDMETRECHCYNCELFDFKNNVCKCIDLCKKPAQTFNGFYVKRSSKL